MGTRTKGQRRSNASISKSHLTFTKDAYWIDTSYGGGIGSGMMISIVNFMKAIELKKIYRPASHWLWAERNASLRCENTFGSIDCFNLPLSYCWYKSNVSMSSMWPVDVYINHTDASLLLTKKNRDICTLAKIMKK